MTKYRTNADATMRATTSASTKRKSDGPVSIKSKKTKTVDETKSSTQQKRALKHERQAHRKHADAVMESKDIWNKLRLKTNTKEETAQLMEQLMSLLQGKFRQVALQHDASRVVQAAIQFGTPQQRKEVVMELCEQDDLQELCKVQYAHFCVLKMIKYCYRDAECVRAIVKVSGSKTGTVALSSCFSLSSPLDALQALKGSIPKLAVHSVGARVVELLFSTFSTKASAPLKQELYGPHFSLFGDETNHAALASNLEIAPDKKQVTLEFILGILNKALEKGLYSFVYLQELAAEYVEEASCNDVRAMAPTVVDHSIHMLSTRAGTRVVAACASYGTAKDRKRIMKSLKGYTKSSLLHRDAYLAILRLVQMTDDTVSIHKSVLAEILNAPSQEESEASSLLEIALDTNGSKLFLMLLVSSQEERIKYLDPYERQVLAENPCVLENGQETPTSKKNAETRRKELLNHLRKPLIELCTNHANELVRSLPGSRVLHQVFATFSPQEVVNAVVNVCVAELDVEENSLFEDPIGHLAIKNLLLCDVDDQKAMFATAFYEKMHSRLMDVAKSNRGAFVLTALLKVDAVRERALSELTKHKTELKKLSIKGKATAGYNALLQEIAGKGK
jgi:pumilio family protein 6